ncbi:MAG: DUF378 domain-containing protein [Candidatus Marinimicrobia bacterium]|nr:DUF378 domain-containing protein [Candidatus Neomarinimicrobiota bacterium]MDA1364062.1 DUF378 domain-containing protein [Candidatus Neomarinimicrobiota bacterium]
MNKYLNSVTLLLIIIGGVNWLLVGLFEFNLVNYLFSDVPILEKAIYTLVGISALYCISLLKQVSPELFNKIKF